MILNPLYKVSLIAEDGKHFYTVDVDPTYYPGVTGILNNISKSALVPWAAKETALFMQKVILKVRGRVITDRFLETLVKRAKKQPYFIRDKAAVIGSHAHGVFDAIINNAKEVPAATPFSDSFMYWLSKEKLRIVQGDTKIFSKQYGYGGSLDALAVTESGEPVIIDFKTGNYLYESHAFQVAAYSQAFKETFGWTYRPTGVIVRFVKGKKQFERREIRDIDDSFTAFKAALDLSHALDLVHFENRQLIKEKKEKTHATA